MSIEPISDERLAEIREDAQTCLECGILCDNLPSHILALLARLEEAETSVGIMKALTRTPLYSHRALTEKLSQIIGARFGARFMDPPDGGDVPIYEQVERMADALLAAERTPQNSPE